MKALASAVVIVTVFASAVGAQQPSDAHQHSTPPPNARFEIIQSELAAKWTFRLDRFNGRVAQLVRTKDGDNEWEEMQVIGLSRVQAQTRPHFQIFTSGLAVRHTFLIDTDTGKTWVVVTVKRKRTDGSEYEVSVWQPFEE